MNNSTQLYFKEVLDSKRLEILPKLTFLKDLWFYLAWWTALALQYWHRKSIDFDFFTSKEIDTEKLFNIILNNLKKEKILKTYEEKNTLYLEINWIKFSFITFKQKNLKDFIETKNINILSDIEIATMKIWTIQNRATNKDYIDLYYILQKYSLDEIINNFYKKFWKIISENLIRKSLVYFDDIIEEELILNKNISFKEVKNYLQNIIK